MCSRHVVGVCALAGLIGLGFGAGPPTARADDSKTEWKVGTASVAITPDEPMWMAGYASRDKPSEGKVHDLYARAMAFEDPHGTRLLVVTLDLVGIPREIVAWLESQVAEKHQIGPESFLLNVSHTHCGPEVRFRKVYLPKDRASQCREYGERLQSRILEVVGQALGNMAPASLSYTHARAGFAMNRRTPIKDTIRNFPNPNGPFDHDVPVLLVRDADDGLQALLFGYACHATTLSFYEFCGDYPGFAQQYLKESHPGVMTLFLAGCGGDQNPYPRRELDMCKQHGRALANGVETALETVVRPIGGPLRAAKGEVVLDFAEPPGREQLEQEARSKNRWERRHAEVLLAELEETGKLRTTLSVPVQVIRFGDGLLLVALPGEVVVDYSLRLKSELAGPAVWVAGYSNDIFGYLPSDRVLAEGGYEGGGAMRYTSFPGPFAPSVETRIIEKVHELVEKTQTPPKPMEPSS